MIEEYTASNFNHKDGCSMFPDASTVVTSYLGGQTRDEQAEGSDHKGVSRE
jgi:hypothetical protein